MKVAVVVTLDVDVDVDVMVGGVEVRFVVPLSTFYVLILPFLLRIPHSACISTSSLACTNKFSFTRCSHYFATQQSCVLCPPLKRCTF